MRTPSQNAEFLQPMPPYPGLERFVQTVRLPGSGLELFYYAAGSHDLPPALLIHGLGDEADTWRHFIGPLSASWRVIAPDLPGFGRSARPDVAYDQKFLLSALIGLLDALGIEKTLLIGHSLGGMLAHRIALDHPEKVFGLILISGSLLLQPRSLSPQILLFLVPGIGEWLYNRLRKDPQTAYETLRPYYADLDALPAADRDFLYQRVNQRVWSDDQRRAYFSTLRRLATSSTRPTPDLKGRLSGLHVPTLILWGEQDQVYASASGQSLAVLQPDAEFVLLPGLGHNLHQEDPARLLGLITADRRFAAEIPPGSTG